MNQFSRTRQARQDKKKFVYIFLILGVVFAGSFLCTWTRTMHTSMGYRLAAAYKIERNEEAKNAKARSLEALLKSPPRIEEYAKDVLGLRYPNEEQVVTLKDKL